MNNLLTEIEILFQKELFDQCLFLISKSEKIARDYEKFNYLTQILAWKRKAEMSRKNIFAKISGIDEILDQEKEALNIASVENEYWKLLIFHYRNFEDFKQTESPLLNDHSLAKSLTIGSALTS